MNEYQWYTENLIHDPSVNNHEKQNWGKGMIERENGTRTTNKL